MMSNLETERSIRSCVANFTDLVPEIRFREDVNDILFTFLETIPDEATTKEIETALQEYGKVIPAAVYRESSYLAYLIIRSC